ncbi:MAG: response regulator [Treponema sp.]|nr:response regulator [Treponema sp.]
MAISDYLLTSAVTGSRKKIIYVDDVQYSRLTIKNKLGEYYEVYTVESAVKMFEVIDKIGPNLIILDINMPEMDGFDIIVKLKYDNRYSMIPIIFLTSRTDKESVMKGLKLGAADFFTKPFDTKKLIESIEKHLNSNNENKIKTEENNETRPNILIVDDITIMLRTIHFSLHNKYNVTLLSKSELVMEYLQNNETDLILLDLLMPGLTGYDLIPMIRALPEYSDIPILVISTEGKKDTINEVLKLGANDFITKPFTPEELNVKVDRHLRIGKHAKRMKNEIDYFLS